MEPSWNQWLATTRPDVIRRRSMSPKPPEKKGLSDTLTVLTRQTTREYHCANERNCELIEILECHGGGDRLSVRRKDVESLGHGWPSTIMSEWVPLFQTLVWVLFITGILWRFNPEVRSLVRTLCERIEKGSSVKAGPFELGSLPSQVMEEQRKSLQAAADNVATGLGAAQPAQPSGAKGLPTTLRTTVLLAEDLAIRRLQSDFGVSVSRQLRLGANLELDGLFIFQGVAYVVEVKYVYRELDVASLLIRTTQLLTRTSQEWARSAVILALVYADQKRLTEAERSQVKESFRSLGDRVIIRFYLFDELARQLGLVDG